MYLNQRIIVISSVLALLAIINYAECSPIPGIDTELDSTSLGSLSEQLEPTPEVHELLQSQSKTIRDKLQRDFKSLEAISFSTQLVAGTNYFIKCKVTELQGDESIIHVRIYKPIKAEAQLSAIAEGHTIDSKIEFFE